MAKKLVLAQLERLLGLVMHRHARGKEGRLVDVGELLSVISGRYDLMLEFGPKYRNKISRTLLLQEL